MISNYLLFSDFLLIHHVKLILDNSLYKSTVRCIRAYTRLGKFALLRSHRMAIELI